MLIINKNLKTVYSNSFFLYRYYYNTLLYKYFTGKNFFIIKIFIKITLRAHNCRL